MAIIDKKTEKIVCDFSYSELLAENSEFQELTLIFSHDIFSSVMTLVLFEMSDLATSEFSASNSDEDEEFSASNSDEDENPPALLTSTPLFVSHKQLATH